MPTSEELDNNNIHVYWLTDAVPWDPTTTSESLDDTMPVPIGYSNDMGELDLLGLSLDFSNLGEANISALDETVKIKQAFCWIK